MGKVKSALMAVVMDDMPATPDPAVNAHISRVVEELPLLEAENLGE